MKVFLISETAVKVPWGILGRIMWEILTTPQKDGPRTATGMIFTRTATANTERKGLNGQSAYIAVSADENDLSEVWTQI